jgi:arylsulfatase A-like enzyme
VEAEALGADDTPDVLAVSFTAPDYAGHAYGPDSHEVQDSILAVDRAVTDLLAFLDQKVGKDRLLVAFTADHGSAAAPEKLAAEGKKARRIKKAELKSTVSKALVAKFGEGEWVLALEDPSLYLNTKLAAEKKIDPQALETVARDAALTVPGITAGFTRTEITSRSAAKKPFFEAIRLAFHPERAGEVMLVPAPNSFWGKYAEKDEGSTHGSPHRYDAHVPLAIAGAGVPRRVVSAPVQQADLAPTLAAMVGVTIENADGKARPEVVGKR